MHENLISFSRDISQFDLIPVSPSDNLLQRMINTCCEEAVYLDMKFDALKSNNISYGPKYTDLNIELHADSIAIPCVNPAK